MICYTIGACYHKRLTLFIVSFFLESNKCKKVLIFKTPKLGSGAGHKKRTNNKQRKNNVRTLKLQQQKLPNSTMFETMNVSTIQI